MSFERADACDTYDEQGESPQHIIAQGVGGRMSQNQRRSEPSLAVHHALPIHLLLPASASVGVRQTHSQDPNIPIGVSEVIF